MVRLTLQPIAMFKLPREYKAQRLGNSAGWAGNLRVSPRRKGAFHEIFSFRAFLAGDGNSDGHPRYYFFDAGTGMRPMGVSFGDGDRAS